VHDLDHGQAPDRGRGGDEIVAPIAAPDRLALDRLVGCEIGFGDESAARGERSGDLVRQRAAVEFVRSAGGDPAQGPGQTQVPEDPSGLEGEALGAD